MAAVTPVTADEVADHAETRLKDASHLIREVVTRSQTEPLYVMRAAYVARNQYLLAFLTDCAIRHVIDTARWAVDPQ